MTFADFWEQYPATSKHKGSKAKAERLFNGLSQKRQQRVMDSLPHYAEFLGLKENEYRQPMMCATYLNHRNAHWETYAPDTLAEQLAEQDREKRREELRERKRRQDAAQDRMWREQFEARYGRAPG